MGFFKKDKVKFEKAPMVRALAQYKCLCGEWSDSTPYYDDDIPGYGRDDIMRCRHCGRVFTQYPDGKFVAQSYVGDQRVTLTQWLEAHPEVGAKHEADYVEYLAQSTEPRSRDDALMEVLKDAADLHGWDLQQMAKDSLDKEENKENS